MIPAHTPTGSWRVYVRKLPAETGITLPCSVVAQPAY
jgi:hypothetical protein